MSENKTLGRYVSEERKRLNLNQKQLAEKVGMSPQYLNDIEHDRRTPMAQETLSQLATALNVKLDYLYYLAGRLPEDRAKDLGEEEVERVFRAFRRA